MILVGIECDRCGERWPHARRNSKHAMLALRRSAAERGWTSPEHSGKDYCPKCSSAKPEETANAH